MNHFNSDQTLIHDIIRQYQRIPSKQLKPYNTKKTNNRAKEKTLTKSHLIENIPPRGSTHNS